jgi:hypothetical protein
MISNIEYKERSTTTWHKWTNICTS